MQTSHIINDLLQATNKACINSMNAVMNTTIDAAIAILQEAEVDDTVVMMITKLKSSSLIPLTKFKGTTKGITKKRARTGYNMFVSDQLKFLKINFPDLNTREKMLKASEDWRGLDENEKTRYRDMALVAQKVVLPLPLPLPLQSNQGNQGNQSNQGSSSIPGIPDIPIKKIKIKMKETF